MERDFSPVMASSSLVSDAMFIQQPSGIYVELHGELIRLHVYSEKLNELSGTSLPEGEILIYEIRYHAEKRVLRLCEVFGFNPVELPGKGFFIFLQIHSLVRLVSTDEVKGCSIRCAGFLFEKERSISSAHETIGSRS